LRKVTTIKEPNSILEFGFGFLFSLEAWLLVDFDAIVLAGCSDQNLHLFIGIL
jgi:hypothetical protein